MVLLLLFGAVVDECRADDADAQPTDARWGVDPRHLFPNDGRGSIDAIFKLVGCHNFHLVGPFDHHCRAVAPYHVNVLVCAYR